MLNSTTRNHNRPKRVIGSSKRPRELEPFKPSYINVRYFLEHRNLSKLLQENIWLKECSLYESPELTYEQALYTHKLVRSNYERSTIELSQEFMHLSIEDQRSILIIELCALINEKVFHQLNFGESYELLLKRYTAKANTNQETNKQGTKVNL